MGTPWIFNNMNGKSIKRNGNNRLTAGDRTFINDSNCKNGGERLNCFNISHSIYPYRSAKVVSCFTVSHISNIRPQSTGFSVFTHSLYLSKFSTMCLVSFKNIAFVVYAFAQDGTNSLPNVWVGWKRYSYMLRFEFVTTNSKSLDTIGDSLNISDEFKYSIGNLNCWICDIWNADGDDDGTIVGFCDKSIFTSAFILKLTIKLRYISIIYVLSDLNYLDWTSAPAT